jgi:ribonuclease Z
MKSKSLILLLLSFLIANVSAQRDYSDSDTTKLVVLGSGGGPEPTPFQSGCSLAVIVFDTSYIIDFGPGLVRKAAAMAPTYGGHIKGLEIKNIKYAFLTHLHPDHTLGYPDLLLSPWWAFRRENALEVYGPHGTTQLTDYILKAYGQTDNQESLVNTHEYTEEGIIYQDDYVKVEAFPVIHIPNSWGFRFTTPDKVIVISGDTAPSEKVVEYSRGADILAHEVYTKKGYDIIWANDEARQIWHKSNHTSTYELGDIARKINPKLLVLYHVIYWGASEQDLREELNEKYEGRFIVGHDLDVF